jgi:colicin import membrane protein
LNFHASLVGPNGQVYHCEHNHRTETAAMTCANSSATRGMANLAWQRAAVQAAQAATLARQREQERATAQARRIAAQQAEAARRAVAQQEEAAKRAAAQRAAEDAKRAAEEVKAAKRAAKLAAMPLRRAWKLMTPEERLIKTAEAELQVYGTIISPEAKAAYDGRSGKISTPNGSPQAASAPPVSEPWWLQPGIRS